MNALVIFRNAASLAAVSKCVELAQVPRPAPHPSGSQLLVRVRAASLQVEDLFTATRRRPLLTIAPTEDAPVTLGIEFVGEVVAAGPGAVACGWSSGDRVMGLKRPIRARHGCWAELVSVPMSDVAHVPVGWSDAQAAAFPMSSLVALAAADCVKNPEGQRVAVVGASGGIGSILVRLLASRGSHVVGVCSERNAAFVRSCGAKEIASRESGGLSSYRTCDNNEKLLPPLDYVLDCVGGDDIEKQAAETLKHRGHFVTIVGPGEGTFGSSDGSVGVARGALISTKSLASTFFGPYSYSLASMSIFSMGKKMAEAAAEITVAASDCTNKNEKGLVLISQIIPANDMAAVRAALDALANHKTSGRKVLDFSVFS